MLRKDAFQWGTQSQAFQTMPFTIETDACAKRIGAVLMQKSRPIAFLSKSLGPSLLLNLYMRKKPWLY